jgi:hypothetical protein
VGNTVGSECLELLGRPRPQHGAQVSGSIIAAERRKQGLGVSSPCMSLAAVDSALWKAQRLRPAWLQVVLVSPSRAWDLG